MSESIVANLEPILISGLQDSNLTVISPGTREVVRCARCKLVQFRTISGFCRRCDQSLTPPQPEAPEPASLEPSLEPMATPDAAAVPDAVNHTVEFRGKTMPGFSLGLRLRELRQFNNLTQAQIARKAHVPRTYVSRIEHCHLLPGLGVVRRLAEALAVEVLDLLPNQGDDRSSPEPSNDPYWNALARNFRCLRTEQQSAVLSRIRALLRQTHIGSAA